MTNETQPFGLVGLADSDGLGPNVPPNYEDGWNDGVGAQRALTLQQVVNDLRDKKDTAEENARISKLDFPHWGIVADNLQATLAQYEQDMRELGIEPEEAT